jgi:hypothetical protein
VAIELVLKNWCDVCLEGDVHTPGETITVNVSGVAAFDVEACKEHAQPLADAVEVLAALGRAPGKTVRPGPVGAPKGTSRSPKATDPAPGPCPECGHVSPAYGSLRYHVRRQHGKSMADVGMAEARFTCDVCGSGFPNGQGLAAHRRIGHPDAVKQTA